jgi:hypothetical protein
MSLADDLLEAQVKYELARLSGGGLRELVTEHVGATFAWLGEVTLEQLTTREHVVGIIERTVIEMRVSGGITELAGEMARAVITSQASTHAQVSDVVDRVSYQDFTEKLLGLDAVRTEIIGLCADSPAFGAIVSRILSHGLLDLIFGRGRARSGEDVRKQNSELLSDLYAGILPELERRMEELLGRYLEKHRARITHEARRHLVEVIDADALRNVVDELWAALNSLPLSEAFEFVGTRDIEDFVVICYEFWLRFRKSRFFRDILHELVSFFFDKYGSESVSSLIEDMGVSERMVREELLTFLGPLIAQAVATGFLAERLRALLGPFYRSPELAALLARHGAPEPAAP